MSKTLTASITIAFDTDRNGREIRAAIADGSTHRWRAHGVAGDYRFEVTHDRVGNREVTIWRNGRMIAERHLVDLRAMVLAAYAERFTVPAAVAANLVRQIGETLALPSIPTVATASHFVRLDAIMATLKRHVQAAPWLEVESLRTLRNDLQRVFERYNPTMRAAWNDDAAYIAGTAPRLVLLCNSYRYWRAYAGRNASLDCVMGLARADVAAKTTRYPSRGSSAWGAANNGARYNEKPAGLRDFGPADKARPSMSHQGWFIDAHQDETYRGHVWQLAGKAGKARFVAGYVESMNGGAIVDLQTIYDAPGDDISDALRDAARAGDSMAERAAEKERDYQAAASAGHRWSELADDIESARSTCLQLFREARAAGFRKLGCARLPFLALAIRESIMGKVRSIREARAQMARLADGQGYGRESYGSFWTGDANLRDAFNESAGRKVI